MRILSAIMGAVVVLAVGTADGAEPVRLSSEPVKEPVKGSVVAPVEDAGVVVPAQSASNADELEVKWSVMAGGGKTVTAGDLKISGTIGQSAAGWTSGLQHDVHAGFWQNFAYTPCCENRGNVDHRFTNTSPMSVADVAYLVAQLFRGGPDAPCMVEADLTGDGGVNIADLAFLIAYLFRGGPAPGAC